MKTITNSISHCTQAKQDCLLYLRWFLIREKKQAREHGLCTKQRFYTFERQALIFGALCYGKNACPYRKGQAAVAWAKKRSGKNSWHDFSTLQKTRDPIGRTTELIFHAFQGGSP